MARFVLLVTWIVSAFPAHAEGPEEVPDLITDRPDITESSQTVPRASLQLETGGRFNYDTLIQNRVEVELTSFDMFDTLLRFGLTKSIELRLSSLYTIKSSTGSEEGDTDGVNGLILGAKFHLAEESGARPDMGLIVDIGLPVGREELTGRRALPGFILAASHSLSERVGLAYNLGGRWNSESTFIARYSGTVPVVVFGSVGAFAEVFGTAGRGIRPMVSIDGGLAWQPRRNLQLDGAAGVGLTEEGDDIFATLGLSFRLPE